MLLCKCFCGNAVVIGKLLTTYHPLNNASTHPICLHFTSVLALILLKKVIDDRCCNTRISPPLCHCSSSSDQELISPCYDPDKKISVPNNTVPIVNLRSSDIIAYVLAIQVCSHLE